MTDSPSPDGFPKLRPLDVRWIEDKRQEYILLRDPLGFSPEPVVLAGAAAPLLAMCDGTRDLASIRASAELRAGLSVTPAQLEEFVASLDRHLLLDNGRFRGAVNQALAEYRAAAHRPPALAGRAYPQEPHQLSRALQGYGRPGDTSAQSGPGGTGRVMGLLSPHIDYARGGPVYAQSWPLLAEDLEQAELVVVLGTDHAGGPGSLTLTRKAYGTPLGVSPTDPDLVDALAKAIGPDEAFASELHHRNEHSVELATVWLHHALGGRTTPMVPVLCGSMHRWVSNGDNPARDGTFQRFLSVLGDAMARRRTVVVAAGDLAHVGPAFGDPAPFDDGAKARLREADRESLAAMQKVDARGFFTTLQREKDQRRYCGLTPIYLMLRLLEQAGGAQGQLVSYDQCPADEQGGSVVSIAGMVFRTAG